MEPLASVNVFVNAAANTELKSMCRATLTALVIFDLSTYVEEATTHNILYNIMNA